MRHRTRKDERGLTVVFLALSITGILLAAAFVVDLGWWYIRAQEAQRTADAAALAGVVWMPNDFPRAIAVARETAKANGFAHGVSNISVDVSVGTTNRQLAVRIVDGNVTRFFSSVATRDKMSIGRRAVAQYEMPVPLGGPENQFGAGLRGVYLAVNGFCTRRADGDQISAAYYHQTYAGTSFNCQTPYALAAPTPPVAKNPDYRPSGYTYVVSIPPAQTVGCAVANPPVNCSRTGAPVTIEVSDPRLNKNATVPPSDQYTFPNNPVTCTTRPGTTYFRVFSADTSPLDDSNNPPITADLAYNEETAAGGWEPLTVVPTGSPSGRYLVRVRSAADQACGAWSNAFGIRAAVNGAFSACSTLPGSTLPAGYPFCPQVYGVEAMGIRVALTAATTLTCEGTKAAPSNKCTSFFLAQVDPAYAGKQMAITLFDPGEGAQRLRVLAPKVGSPNGVPIGFSYTTVDDQLPVLAGTVTAASSGLDVSALVDEPNTFNDRKVQITATLPNATNLGANGGWFRVEYEVGTTATSLTDRTTWGVNIRGAPVRLVA